MNNIKDDLLMFSVTSDSKDSINVKDRLIKDDNKLIIFCANWCTPSYDELNRLYNSGVIDSLIQKNFSLIMISITYPPLKLNHPKIQGDWSNRLFRDFEIYYDLTNNILFEISCSQTFPHLILIIDNKVVYEIDGVQDDYSFLTNLKSSKKRIVCPRCHGTGRVNSSPKYGGADEAVGICPQCNGK